MKQDLGADAPDDGRAVLVHMNAPCATCRHLQSALNISNGSTFTGASVECARFKNRGAILCPREYCEEYEPLPNVSVH